MEEKLIEFISRNRFLFDKSNKNYKNKFLRDQKFQELSEELHIPAEKLKGRWRNLCDKFYKDIRKKPSGSGVDSPHKKWKWLDRLMFLKDVEMNNLNTHGNYGELEEVLEGDDSIFSGDFSESAGSSMSSEPLSQRPKTTPLMAGRKRRLEDLIESANSHFKRVASLAENVLEVRGFLKALQSKRRRLI